MKKFPNFKGVLENIRGSVGSGEKSVKDRFTSWLCSDDQKGVPARLESEIIEALAPNHFKLERTSLHGFPFKPTAVAFDPVQKVLAIGNRHGSVRVLGKPGLDMSFQHDSRSAVIQLDWLANTGQLVTACCDDTIYLWDIKKEEAELVQSLRFNRERITCFYTALKSKWMYIGTDKGNVHIVNLDSFSLSGYTIQWNKAIDMMQTTHPGQVIHLSENPADPSKLLIGFETGTLCLWDLSNKKGEQRYSNMKKFYSVSWHWEGRQFVCSCSGKIH